MNGEDVRNVYPRPRRTKKQVNRDEQYTKRNKLQNNWCIRMDKWPEVQNGGNHCCRTDYRKMNKKKKKMKTAYETFGTTLKSPIFPL